MNFFNNNIRTFVTAALLVMPVAAFAAPTIVLTPSTNSPKAGTTVDFNGTFTDPGAAKNTSYTIEGATFDLTSPAGDQVDFTSNYLGDKTIGNKTTGDFTVGAGQSITADNFFDLTLSPKLGPGTYTGTIDISYLLNGDDNQYDNFYDPCCDQTWCNTDPTILENFSITIPQPVSTPEPSGTLALGLGALALGGLMVAKRRSAKTIA